MKRTLLLIMLFGGGLAGWTAWCLSTTNTPPAAYQRMSDRLKVALGLGEGCRDGVNVIPTSQCYALSAPTQYAGIWLEHLDGTDCFLPGRVELPEPLSDEQCMMLNDERGVLPEVNDRQAPSGDYEFKRRVSLVTFVGRQTLYPAPAPPVGGSIYLGDLYSSEETLRHSVVVDRVISLRVLEEERLEQR